VRELTAALESAEREFESFFFEELTHRLPTLRLVPDQTWCSRSTLHFAVRANWCPVVRNRGSIHPRA
jgi:hypothetical protein